MTPQLQGTLLAVGGVVLMSFDSLLIRLAGVSGVDVSVWRGFFIACTMLSALVLRPHLLAERPNLMTALRRGGWPMIALGMVQGLGSFLFPLSLTFTSVPDALFILSASPLCAALLSRLLLGERLPLRTLVAALAVIFGLGIIFQQAGGGGGSAPLLGDLLSAVVALTLAATFVGFRRFPQADPVAVLCVGGFSTLLYSLPMADPFSVPQHALLWLALLGIGVLPLSGWLFSISTRYITAPEVGLIMVLESLLGSLLVYLFLGEKPSGGTAVGGTVVIVSLMIHSWLAVREAKRQQLHLQHTDREEAP